MKVPRFKDPLLLESSLDELSGIGPKRRAAFLALGLRTVEDLLRFLPRAYINRTRITPMAKLSEGAFASVLGAVKAVKPGGPKRFTVILEDATGRVALVFFGGARFLSGRFETGMRINGWGRVTEYNGLLQMAHPDYKILKKGEEPEKGIFPVYTRPEELKEATVDSKIVAAAVSDALARVRERLPENVPSFYRDRHGYPPLKTVYRELHFPENDEPGHLALLWERLKYEEAFLLCLKMRRLGKSAALAGTACKPGLKLPAVVSANAGFAPTKAQERVLKEIEEDLFSARRMNRLLQGDVGSGKTFVCALAAAHVLESGRQVLVMAPTEILARQHFREFSRLFECTGVKVVLLVAALEPSVRKEAEDAVKAGGAVLVIGTHALLSEGVEPPDPGLLIVDEQHRFGVRQRMALRRKGKAPDLLAVSATPIPRTLALTLYGDLSLSVIDEMPPGRIPVRTHLVPERKRPDMIKFIAGKIKEGGRAFFILPLIEESEKLEEVKSVIEYAAHLRNTHFPEIGVEMVHGRMGTEEKEGALNRFRDGRCPILAATTVVEVGIDIPEADIMVVEHPERFGLAQLHQLRGRIGRGKRESFCFLLPGPSTPPETQERLSGFAATADGFAVAELDFAARGPGELSGLRQSGLPGFRFLDLVRDRAVVEKAVEDTSHALLHDAELPSDERLLLEQALKAYGGDAEQVLETA